MAANLFARPKTSQTERVLSLRHKLSSRQKLWLGFLWCPLMTWLLLGAQIVFALVVNAAFPYLFDDWPLLPLVLALLSFCVYWVCVAVFCGFGAAFFWNYSPSHEDARVFWSVTIAWMPILFFGFLSFWWVLPFLVFASIYSISLESGLKFWNSNSPREWVGDFSGRGDDS